MNSCKNANFPKEKQESAGSNQWTMTCFTTLCSQFLTPSQWGVEAPRIYCQLENFCQIDFSSKVVNDEKWRVGPGDSLTGQSGLSRLALLVKSVNLWGNLAERCVQT